MNACRAETVRWLCAAFALCSATFAARPARAEDATAESQAKALFADARLLVKSGYYGEACPKFEQSLALHAGLGIEFNLADCLDRTGQTERARELFLDVADKAHVAKQTDRERVARGRAAALELSAMARAPAETTALVVINAAPSAGAQAEIERGCNEHETPARILSDESDSLAEAAARVHALERNAAQLIGVAPEDPDAQRVRRKLAQVEAELADAWRLAGQVATQLARQTRSAERGSSIPVAGTPERPLTAALAPAHANTLAKTSTSADSSQ
jgi:hypothetical protein